MLPAPVPGLELPTAGPLLDRFGRAHTYLRVSVTDRCNFRCTYCMPAEGLDWTRRERLLTYEEIARVVGLFAGMGIERVRLTGGEPTVRKVLDRLVALLAATPGVRDVSLTTNGHLFAKQAGALARAGLSRVNVSLDSVDPQQFARITRGGDLARVLAAIDAAREAGLRPLKINAVIMRGVNEDQVDAIVDHFAPHAADTHVRFIEFMPFSGLGDRKMHWPAREMRAHLARRTALEPLAAPQGGGPASHWRLADSGLVVGFISPITEHFCQACNRLRLSCDGELRTCLSRDDTPNLRDLLRAGADDATLEQHIRAMVWGKVAGHEADQGEGFRAFEGVMTRVGG